MSNASPMPAIRSVVIKNSNGTVATVSQGSPGDVRRRAEALRRRAVSLGANQSHQVVEVDPRSSVMSVVSAGFDFERAEVEKKKKLGLFDPSIVGSSSAATKLMLNRRFTRMETLLELMVGREELFVQDVKQGALWWGSVIKSAFKASDFVHWMMTKSGLHFIDETEATLLCAQFVSDGYIFAVNRGDVFENNGSLWRIQAKYFWPSTGLEPTDGAYAVYLLKRSLKRNKKHGRLSQAETAALSKLRNRLKSQWAKVTMEAMEKAKIERTSDAAERDLLQSREEAYWDRHRPMGERAKLAQLDPMKTFRSQAIGVIDDVSKMSRPDMALQLQLIQLKANFSRPRLLPSLAARKFCERITTLMPVDRLLTDSSSSSELMWSNAPDPDTAAGFDRAKRRQTLTIADLKLFALSFDDLIAHPMGVELFRNFLCGVFAVESIDFYLACHEYVKIPANELQPRALEIYNRFISENAADQVNLTGQMRADIEKSLAGNIQLRWVFEEAVDRILNILRGDLYQRFLQSDVYLAQCEPKPLQKREGSMLSLKAGATVGSQRSLLNLLSGGAKTPTSPPSVSTSPVAVTIPLDTSGRASESSWAGSTRSPKNLPKAFLEDSITDDVRRLYFLFSAAVFSLATIMTYTREQLEGMKRAELQALAKENAIKANQKSEKLIEALLALHPTVIEESCTLEVMVEVGKDLQASDADQPALVTGQLPSLLPLEPVVQLINQCDTTYTIVGAHDSTADMDLGEVHYTTMDITLDQDSRDMLNAIQNADAQIVDMETQENDIQSVLQELEKRTGAKPNLNSSSATTPLKPMASSTVAARTVSNFAKAHDKVFSHQRSIKEDFERRQKMLAARSPKASATSGFSFSNIRSPIKPIHKPSGSASLSMIPKFSVKPKVILPAPKPVTASPAAPKTPTVVKTPITGKPMSFSGKPLSKVNGAFKSGEERRKEQLVKIRQEQTAKRQQQMMSNRENAPKQRNPNACAISATGPKAVVQVDNRPTMHSDLLRI